MFFRKNLGDLKTFVDGFWRQIKQDAQYQLKDVMDWAAHLEHLQAMLKKFDPVAAPHKEILIWCFRKGLQLSIQVQMDSQHRELDF